jgi:protoheme IX farnesyltransferase
MSAPVATYTRQQRSLWSVSVALWEMTKARLSSLVLLTTAVGFALAEPAVIVSPVLGWTLLGTLLAAFGANALNQCLEYPRDLQMARTCRRAIPSGRVGIGLGFAWSGLLLGSGTILLTVVVNPVAGALALLVGLLYVGAYTPLKQRTSLATLIGAVCGAIPPIIGWVAASGSLSVGAPWVLFAILFLWQIPHFLAIDWFYREDYSRGGFTMVSKVDPTGRLSSNLIVVYSLALIPVSLLATPLGLGGLLYFIGAIVLGMAYFGLSVAVWVAPTRASARRLFLGSLLYLPLLLGLLLLDPTA